jgi:hypothetical protein
MIDESHESNLIYLSLTFAPGTNIQYDSTNWIVLVKLFIYSNQAKNINLNSQVESVPEIQS